MLPAGLTPFRRSGGCEVVLWTAIAGRRYWSRRTPTRSPYLGSRGSGWERVALALRTRRLPLGPERQWKQGVGVRFGTFDRSLYLRGLPRHASQVRGGQRDHHVRFHSNFRELVHGCHPCRSRLTLPPAVPRKLLNWQSLGGPEPERSSVPKQDESRSELRQSSARLVVHPRIQREQRGRPRHSSEVGVDVAAQKNSVLLSPQRDMPRGVAGYF